MNKTRYHPKGAQIKAIRSTIVKSIASVKDGLIIFQKRFNGSNNEFTSKIKSVPTQERQFMELNVSSSQGIPLRILLQKRNKML
jgi:hypothetical protein